MRLYYVGLSAQCSVFLSKIVTCLVVYMLLLNKTGNDATLVWRDAPLLWRDVCSVPTYLYYIYEGGQKSNAIDSKIAIRFLAKQYHIFMLLLN